MNNPTITLLGTGTSQGVPVIGCSCEVCQSENPRDKRLRTSALLQNADTNVLIDAGPDMRQQLLRTGINHLEAVVITHEHNDHVIGLDDLRPFIFRQEKSIVVYAEPRVQEEIRARFAYAFAENPYPGAPSFELRDLVSGQPVQVGNFPDILPLRIMHGKLPIIGFRIQNLAYLTDTKTIPQETRKNLKGLDTLIVSALHHSQHHSHMNLEEALTVANEVGARQTYFIHMSHNMGRVDEVEPTLPEGIHFGYDGLTLKIV